MGRSKVKQAAYQKKYMDAHVMLTAILDRKKDKDIISWLEAQENRSEAIRRALRDSMRYEACPVCGMCKHFAMTNPKIMVGTCLIEGRQLAAETSYPLCDNFIRRKNDGK